MTYCEHHETTIVETDPITGQEVCDDCNEEKFYRQEMNRAEGIYPSGYAERASSPFKRQTLTAMVGR